MRQPGAAQPARSTQRCARLRARDARGRRRRARNFVLDVTDRDIAAPKLRAELRRAKADGVLTLSSDAAETSLRGQEGGRPRDRAKVATFDLAPEILEAVKDGRMLFAVDQQAYLQGYLPIVLLDPAGALRPLPVAGQTVSTGPNFVTKENAQLALQTSARGIR